MYQSTRSLGRGREEDSRSVQETQQKIEISARSHAILRQILEENPWLREILQGSPEGADPHTRIAAEITRRLEAESPAALAFQRGETGGREAFEALRWQDAAAIRLLDYVERAGLTVEDPNLHGQEVVSDPIGLLHRSVVEGSGGASPEFFLDMLELFRQLRDTGPVPCPPPETVRQWMARHPAGTDEDVVRLRLDNRERILDVLLDKMEQGTLFRHRFRFEAGMNRDQKLERMREWWGDHRFHLAFAIRSPALLNELLDHSLSSETLDIMERAHRRGIPLFVNPYYLSLLNVRAKGRHVGADLAIRQYVLYSAELIEEFGRIAAWEKEDEVEPGKPNAAGWLLPSRHSVHRRYPEVAILIPETVGRACGGLCASCQRMYDFQSGHLNFDLDKLRPDETWPERLQRLMGYFENDSQLRDILITGGDALMSADRSVQRILDAVYEMAVRKRDANRHRKPGEKYAEIVRVRMGTRLPAYLPQRVTASLAAVLADFRWKAAAVGIRQFVIQTHFESPLEVTPEARECIRRLTDAGWIVTNQLVFTSAASRRGHTARLREVLNDAGVVTYYTFSVKGYRENRHNFATNARAVQEQLEEKYVGRVPPDHLARIRDLGTVSGRTIQEEIADIRAETGVPFLATDRNVLNLPGVGKSLTFRTVGITPDGRRILEFDHDHTRVHSPIIERLGKVLIVESKAIAHYLEQVVGFGDDPAEYASIWGYSIGETERRMPIYEYPEYPFPITRRLTNLSIEE
jgi:lysine 2,3-aminomutase